MFWNMAAITLALFLLVTLTGSSPAFAEGVTNRMMTEEQCKATAITYDCGNGTKLQECKILTEITPEDGGTRTSCDCQPRSCPGIPAPMPTATPVSGSSQAIAMPAIPTAAPTSASGVSSSAPRTSGEKDTTRPASSDNNVSLPPKPRDTSILVSNSAVHYSRGVSVEESKIYMTTSSGKKRVSVLPDDAVRASEMPKEATIFSVELREVSQKPVYTVSGARKARLLKIIPVVFSMETNIDGDTGAVLSVKKPWWSSLAW